MLAIQKAYHKNASDFYLGKQELQASLKVSSKIFTNNGLYLNLPCDTINHNFLFLSSFCSFEIHLQLHTSLFVGYHYLFDSDIRNGDLDFILSCCSFILSFTFLVSVVVGIVYKDLHEVLFTDQPFRTLTGTTGWGYLLKFLNQMPLPSKIHIKRNSRGWTYKVADFSKPCWEIISHMNQWSFPCSIN